MNETAENSNGSSENDLGDIHSCLATPGPRNDVSARQPLALEVSSELSPAIQYIAERWHQLPPHVREAVITLIDCAPSAAHP